MKIVQLRKSRFKFKVYKRMCHVQSKKHHFLPIYVALKFMLKRKFLNERRMVKDSKTDDFGNYDFSRKNQNFEWRTTLTLLFVFKLSIVFLVLYIFINVTFF